MSGPPARQKNWLLILIRKWHGWIGVSLAVSILFVCFSGIFLNHKDYFLGMKPQRDRESNRPAELLRTTTPVASLSVGPGDVLVAARQHFGDVPIRAIELKAEHGSLSYKVIVAEGRELLMDATTGRTIVRTGYSKQEQARAGAGYETTVDWGKLIKDLHTGKIAGVAGKAAVDAVSAAIILLTASGLYLWAAPKRRQRRAEQRTIALSSARCQV